MTAINDNELDLWARYVREICGIVLDRTKAYLLETRLDELLRESQSATFGDLYRKAIADHTNVYRRKIIDAITTNETSFFRDTGPFDLLRNKLIPDLVDRSRNAGSRLVHIRIWSAACSTGQEAYSIAITLKELLGDLRGYDISIVGTDISDRAVAHASYAHFTRLELDRGMPPAKIATHFEATGGKWKLRDELRALATFRTLNLLGPFAFPAPFDIVFCRNVAIYFSEADRTVLFRNIAKVMAAHGSLIIGSTESLSGISSEYESQRYLRSVFYRLAGSR